MKLKDGTSKYIVWNSNVVVAKVLSNPMAEIIIGIDANYQVLVDY
jgi:hypothetical protein